MAITELRRGGDLLRALTIDHLELALGGAPEGFGGEAVDLAQTA